MTVNWMSSRHQFGVTSMRMRLAEVFGELINNRFAETRFPAVCSSHDKVAIASDLQRRSSMHGELASRPRSDRSFYPQIQQDGSRICTRGDYEIVFQLLLVAVIDKVDARISIAVA